MSLSKRIHQHLADSIAAINEPLSLQKTPESVATTNLWTSWFPAVRISRTHETAECIADAIRGVIEAMTGVYFINILSVEVRGRKARAQFLIYTADERRQEERRQGGDGQVGGQHYATKLDPWELQKVMKSSGSAFVDARRADAIKYAWRMKGDNAKLLEDLKKARHCLDAAITALENNSTNH